MGMLDGLAKKLGYIPKGDRYTPGSDSEAIKAKENGLIHKMSEAVARLRAERQEGQISEPKTFLGGAPPRDENAIMRVITARDMNRVKVRYIAPPKFNIGLPPISRRVDL